MRFSGAYGTSLGAAEAAVAHVVLLCGAANPGCSRLSAGFFPRAPVSLPQERFPSGIVSRSCERASAARLTNPNASYTIVVSAPLGSDNVLARPGTPWRKSPARHSK